MYLEFFHCASFKKKIIKIRSVKLEIQGGHKHTDRQTHKETTLENWITPWRNKLAPLASLATRVMNEHW